MSLLAELRRRNVLRVAAAYAAASWLLVQIVDTVLPVFDTDVAVLRYLIIILCIGFVPAIAVSWAFEWTPEGLKRDEDTPAERDAKARAHTRTWDRVVFVVMALALGLFAVDRFVLQPQRDAELIEAATEAGAEQERNKVPEIAYESVAVIPFVNMSTDSENEYFSDGLTETLLYMLAQLDDLQVAARTSSFAFKGRNMDIVDIASQLRVAHILEGSVQKSNNRIRVTAQLIRGKDGYELWTKRYDGDLDDVFAIQDEIAENVADALGSTLLASRSDAMQGVFTEDVSAYDLFLRARKRQESSTFADLQEAESLLVQALEQDPDFLDAKLALVANGFLKFFLSTGNFAEDFVASEPILAAVLESDPDNLIARQYDLRLRAMKAVGDADLAKRNALMDELLATYDEGFGDPYMRSQLAFYLAAAHGRYEEAARLVQEGLVTDPLNVWLLLASAFIASNTEGPDAAEIPMLTAYKVQPNNPLVLSGLFQMENSRQNIVEGLRWGRKLEIADPKDLTSSGEIALALNEVGLHQEAQIWLAHYRSRTDDPGHRYALELLFAQELDDEEKIEQLVLEHVDGVLRGVSEDYQLRPTLYEYVNIVRRQGRSQEALDYIESFYPGITNFVEGSIDDWTEYMFQYFAVYELLKDVSDEETVRRNREIMFKNREAEELFIGEGTFADIRWQYEEQGIEAALEVFHKVFHDDRYILWGNYRNFRREPWFEELREHPEVIEHFRARNEKVAIVRGEVEELLKEPEWRSALD